MMIEDGRQRFCADVPPAELCHRVCSTIDRFAEREGYDLKRIALLGWSEAQRNERLRATMCQYYLDFRDAISVVIGGKDEAT